VHASDQVLVEVDGTSTLIVGVLGQKLRLHPIYSLNIIFLNCSLNFLLINYRKLTRHLPDLKAEGSLVANLNSCKEIERDEWIKILFKYCDDIADLQHSS
jgi:hypothetical protein